MNINPLVSIIVRTKDRPKLLKGALQSIASQTYRPIEVVLVNDGGCDLNMHELKDMLGDVSIKYKRLEINTGRSHAGNIGIDNSHGSYIGFLDDDDELYPEHVSVLVSFLEKNDYEVAYTDSLMVYKEYDPQTNAINNIIKKETAFSQDFSYDKMLFENYIPFMCLLFSRKTIVAAGGFDTGLDLYEDWDLLLRIGKHYPFYHIRQVTADYNQWSPELQISQRNSNIFFTQKSYMDVISRHLGDFTPQRIHGMVSDYVRMKQNLKDLKNISESLENLVRGYTAQIEVLSASIREKEDKLIFLEGQLRNQTSKIEAVSAAVGDKDAQISALGSDLDAKGARIAELEGELRTLVAQSQALTAAVGDKDAQISALGSDLDAKGARIAELEGELRTLVAQSQALTAAVGDKDAQISALGSDLDAKGARIAELEGELRNHGVRLLELTSGIDCKEAEIISLKNAMLDREAVIELMKNTRGWRLLEKYRKIRDNIILPMTGKRLENTKK